MTISSVRINCFPEDAYRKLELSQSLGGFDEWFECRLKTVKERMRGPEAKGVNIVNFMLYADAGKAWRLSEWGRRANSFEYDLHFDFSSLAGLTPLACVELLMPLMASAARLAPWPQVVAVADLLAEPLSAVDRETLLPYLQWPRTVGRVAKLAAAAGQPKEIGAP